jgi:hypothetical protein
MDHIDSRALGTRFIAGERAQDVAQMACYLARETPVAENEDRLVAELREWADDDAMTLEVARRLTVNAPRANRILDRARRATGALTPR